jgi:hypothetical protein
MLRQRLCLRQRQLWVKHHWVMSLPLPQCRVLRAPELNVR